METCVLHTCLKHKDKLIYLHMLHIGGKLQIYLVIVSKDNRQTVIQPIKKMISLTLFSSQRNSCLITLSTQFTSGHEFLHKVLCSERHAVFSLPSVSLQARHSVHPGFTLPRETGQVPWSPVVAMVIGPGDRGSGGWEVLVSNRMRRVTSIFTMTQPLTAAVGFFPIC